MADVYVDLRGDQIILTGLSAAERELVLHLQQRAESRPNWNDFENFWTQEVVTFYGSLSHRELLQTAGYRIGQDLGGRLAIAAGRALMPDYRDELAEIIRAHYNTRREFCKVTGLAESMLSQVLSGQMLLSIETLTEVLEKIGYQLRLVPRLPIALPDPDIADPEKSVVRIDITDWKVHKP